MNAIPQVGQKVWILEYQKVAAKVVKDVCTSDGRAYKPEHGDDCFVRFERRGGRWHSASKVFADERQAKAALAADFRGTAAALVREAERLEAEAVS